MNGTREQVQVGDPVFTDDVVETSEDGAAGIRFNDDTTFSIGGDARMVLDDFVSELPDHANWRDAFQAVFSMNVQDFYSSLGSGPYPTTGATDDWYEGPAIDAGAALPSKSLTLNAIFSTP